MAGGWIKAVGLALSVSACAPVPGPVSGPVRGPVAGPQGTRASVTQAARNFVTAVAQVEPVAERYCRQIRIAQRCDFQIVVDDRPNQPANAFQMLGPDQRPILGFTLALIADAQNTDEIAFVMGHEASHHILGHIPLTEASARESALLAGILVTVGGGDAAAVSRAQRVGASLGARRFSKSFELQADTLGAEITQRAGFSAIKGAAFFNRIPDPGDRFLGTHPPNADRVANVRKTVAGLR